MGYQAILFDLDGTLLPMDNDEFTEFYFRFLCKDAYEWGYHDSKLLIGSLWKGVAAMVKNDGTRKNHDAFWETFKSLTGRDDPEDEGRFLHFYSERFKLAKEA
ncbi:MAG: HAD family hydrolase, partial [Lachnospiraceae bacterium]|nr:HAD family hydrolase [Lachnospiraceae bacterium]